MKRRNQRTASAMTLLEVTVVVAIIGMIAALVAVVVVDRLQDAKVSLAKSQMAQFVSALDHFYLDNDFYPSTEQGLQALVTRPTVGKLPQKFSEHGYLPAIPLDPWGNPYQYVSPAPDGDFIIVSLGRDGMQGGEGYDKDITNRDIVKTETSKQ